MKRLLRRVAAIRKLTSGVSTEALEDLAENAEKYRTAYQYCKEINEQLSYGIEMRMRKESIIALPLKSIFDNQ